MKDFLLKDTPDFRVLFESLPGLFVALLPDFTIAAASDEYLAAAMRERQEILGRNFFEVFSDNPALAAADDARNLLASLQKVLDTKKSHQMPARRFDVQQRATDDGSFLEKYWEVLNSPVLNQNGEVCCIIHRVEDVTDRMMADKRAFEQNQISAGLRREMRTARENLEQILLNVPDSVYRFDRDFRYVYVNRATTEMFGIKEEDFLGKTLWELFPDVEGNRFHSELQRALEKQEPTVFENYYAPLDRWFENRIYPSGDGVSVFTSEITERKRAEEAARGANELFQVVAQVTNDAIWDWDLATNRISWNEGVTTLFGYAPEQVSDSINWWYQHIHPEDRDFVVAGIHNVIDMGGQQWADEYRFIKADGTFADVLDRGFVIRDAAGNPVRMLGGMTDMTERRLAEERLRKSEAEFRQLANATPALVWICASDGGIIFLNERWHEYTGQTTEEALGYGWAATMEPDDAARILPYWKHCQQTGETYEGEVRYRSKGGEYRWHTFRALPHYNAEGSIEKWFGVSVDVHDAKLAEEALSASEEKFRNLADNISQLAWMAEASGSIFWYNERWFEYTGTTLDEMQGWGWQKVHHSEHVERVTNRFKQSVEAGEAWEDTFPLRSKTGEFRWFLSRALPIRDEAGKVVRWFGTNTDVEEIRQARLQAEQANRLKDEFLATVSHELRTPLNAMLGWATIVRQNGFKPEMMRHAFEIIERNARHQEQIIADILDVSRIITGKLNIEAESVELVSVIKAAIDTVRPAIEAKRINLLTDFANDVQFVKGDASRLQQVVWNLLSNSAKFTPEGGTTSVSLRRGGQFAEITVRDSGEGIVAEFLPYVFDRFRQADGGTSRRHGGLGLGLSIVRHLVELHGGTVLVESEGTGRGATFTVRLPLFTAAYPEPNGGKREAMLSLENKGFPTDGDTCNLAGLRVLTVDDEPDALELLKIMLEARGAIVVTAASVAEALEKLQAAHFDVLISDLGMPVEDGFDLIRKVRKSNVFARIPAIAVTAYARDEDSRRALTAGFTAHLPKPVNGTDLTQTILNLPNV